MAEKTFNEKKGLGRERTRAESPGKRELALVGDFLNLHAPGLRVIEGKGEAAFPIIHPVVGAMLLLGVGDCLGESPDFPLQVLGHTGGMQTDMMLGNPGDHNFGANYC